LKNSSSVNKEAAIYDRKITMVMNHFNKVMLVDTISERTFFTMPAWAAHKYKREREYG
jgi:hypothetical protein